jgi:pyruvyltransferase
LKVRTYFWHRDRISAARRAINIALGRDNGTSFRTGNAGDLFGIDLVRHWYQADVVNDSKNGKRLLIVGSIAHKGLDGDILLGPGLLRTELGPPPPSNALRIWGLRGPMTYDAFKAAGHDLGEVRFLLDPGLLIRFLVSANPARSPRGAIFIPHYRERSTYARSMPPEIRMVDIDATPTRVAEAILGAELVYSSSLHGIIFAHALNRPCVMVRPADQALFKYQDYYASVGLPFPAPLPTIHEADFRTAPVSPAEVVFREEDFVFPDAGILRSSGIAS